MQNFYIFFASAFMITGALFSNSKKANDTWEIDKQHTSVTFDIGHLGISTIRGFMSVNAGKIITDPKDLSKTELEIKLDVNSLNTGVTARDNHVKSDDFLSAEKYPYITFKSTAIREDTDKQKILIDGDLNIKGITKQVTLEANSISNEIRLPKDGEEKIIRATVATTKIDRYDFGINYGKADGLAKVVSELIDGGVGRQITINIFTEFFKIVPMSMEKPPKK